MKPDAGVQGRGGAVTEAARGAGSCLSGPSGACVGARPTRLSACSVTDMLVTPFKAHGAAGETTNIKR